MKREGGPPPAYEERGKGDDERRSNFERREHLRQRIDLSFLDLPRAIATIHRFAGSTSAACTIRRSRGCIHRVCKISVTADTVVVVMFPFLAFRVVHSSTQIRRACRRIESLRKRRPRCHKALTGTLRNRPEILGLTNTLLSHRRDENLA